MHPLNQAQPYPFEQWWIAAYSGEIGREILGRTILGLPVILFRTEAGQVSALSGVCPHRSYPLALGKLEADTVQCPYHGFTFDPSGRCVRVPSQASIPARSDLRRYPCVERGGLVWIWTGAAARADDGLIPPIEAMGLGNPEWVADVSPMVTIEGRYTLLIDNLLDLSHASFIHSDTIPGGGAIAAIPAEIVETEASLNVRRLGRGLPNNPLLRKQFPGHDGPVDQRFDAEYFGPNLIRTGGAIHSAGAAAPIGTQNFIHGITPATPTKVHYFVVTTRDFGIDNPELSAINLAMGDRIQPQDIAAIEAIERNLQVLPAPPSEASCRVDTGALKIRHRLAAQIAAELRSEAA
jgi:vanillate O-demethylase monooxygenase subunit